MEDRTDQGSFVVSLMSDANTCFCKQRKIRICHLFIIVLTRERQKQTNNCFAELSKSGLMLGRRDMKCRESLSGSSEDLEGQRYEQLTLYFLENTYVRMSRNTFWQ